MLTICESDYQRLAALHADMERAMEGLPQAGLDWSPGPEDVNSLCALATHVAGSERYWFGDVIAGESSNRDRAAEFRAQSLDAETLKTRLAGALAYSRQVLEKLAAQDLEGSRTSPHDGKTVAVSWVLAHVLAHTGIHTGHMQLTRQLWDQRQAPAANLPRQRLTVGFADLSHFTGAMEAEGEEEAVLRLQEAYQAAGDAILAGGGRIRKYIGDAILFTFDEPRPAIRAAHQIARSYRRQIGALAVRWNVALATGDVLVGEIGHPAHRVEDVLGETVNRAALLLKDAAMSEDGVALCDETQKHL